MNGNVWFDIWVLTLREYLYYNEQRVDKGVSMTPFSIAIKRGSVLRWRVHAAGCSRQDETCKAAIRRRFDREW